jgi:hypothetical protein
MNINQSTLRAAKNELQPILGRILKEAEIDPSSDINFKDEVVSRYQPMFSPENVASISEEEFKSFLLLKNNHHWSGLHRAGGIITSDMELLREALVILVDEERPIETRLDRLIPKTGAMVSRLGRAVITAILTVTYPEIYGAMNNTTEAGMRELGIWPEFQRGASFGERYSEVNEILTWLTRELQTDFWTLDALWWAVKSSTNGPEVPIIGDEGVLPRFGLEKYLQAFLSDNWDSIANFRDWVLYEEDGDIVGFEYNTGEVGRIDLLAKHKTDPKWLIIELKRDQGTDETLGQVQRYMGWVMGNLAEENDKVEGLIICHSVDASLRYALEPASDIDLLTYEVDFQLHSPEEKMLLQEE